MKHLGNHHDKSESLREMGGFNDGSPGGRRRKRMFDSGEFRVVLLLLIEEKPRHGYELIKELEDRLGGEYSPSPGVVYPTLTLLKDLGYVSVTQSAGGKKTFELTGEGRTFLNENREVGQQALQRISEATPDRPAPINRAIENLRTAMRMRLCSGPLSEQEVRRIAAILDRAVQEIESAPQPVSNDCKQ